MSWLGTACGVVLSAGIGAITAINVRRPWTHVPWRLMTREPDAFGGADAVRTHFIYIFCWSAGLALYWCAVNLLTKFAFVPLLNGVYPALHQDVAPRVGLASEIVSAGTTSISAWLLVRRRVRSIHRNVPAGLIDPEDSTMPALTSERASEPRRRNPIQRLAIGVNMLLDFVLFAIAPYYEHLWRRDGVILAGSATVLLRNLGVQRFLAWYKGSYPELEPPRDVHRALIEALHNRRNGGYHGMSELLRSNNVFAGERRQHQRREVQGVTIAMTLESPTPVQARLMDYSAGGVAVVYRKSLDVSQALRIKVGEKSFDMEVVRCSAGIDCFVVGLRYQNQLSGITCAHAIERHFAR